ncbi:DUF917 domain-containing protein, partial [bacterium]|nr:DUF917 domain-containing protein [bacterium]
MPRDLSRQDLHDLARGAAFLGTGGGGDPWVGRLMVEAAMDAGKTVTLIDLDEVPDDALVIPTAMMGAPTVLVEKVPAGTEAVESLLHLERYLGRKAYATMPIECGGINSTIPLVVGANLGIPVVDADGMGRAFPELHMETFHVYGVSGTPMAITNEHGDSAIVMTNDNRTMEWIARGVTIRMGGAAYIAEYSMDGATARRVSIPGTLSLGIAIGRTIRLARAGNRDPFEAIIAMLAATPYKVARIVFEGKILDVLRRTTEGFARGEAIVESAAGSRLRLMFQNEHLIAEAEGKVLG